MKEQNVIGITTTACADRWNLLRALEPEIMICEEAGEVMEAHALCSLLPSLKHSIFIGDPLQLRPNVNERLMSLETPVGSQYRLDESLFERVMMPRDPLATTLPTSQLNIQRRMHPDIAQLTRITYPFLEDHSLTKLHDPPQGIAKRMFWLDHRLPETIELEFSNSFCNLYEVELIKAFVHYLLHGSGYAIGDIAVLTPYAAQLAKLDEALQTTCSVWLSDRDRELLLDGGLLDLDSEHSVGKTEVEMRNMLRIATVDNFQGEEAKVIILSTVRSGGKVGFLKSRNRINVACSRARDGFYIVGNAETLSQVDMWREVVNVFDCADARGPILPLRCDRHLQQNRYLCLEACSEECKGYTTDCKEMCGAELPCGHKCEAVCHAGEDCPSCQQQCSCVGHVAEKEQLTVFKRHLFDDKFLAVINSW